MGYTTGQVGVVSDGLWPGDGIKHLRTASCTHTLLRSALGQVGMQLAVCPDLHVIAILGIGAGYVFQPFQLVVMVIFGKSWRHKIKRHGLVGKVGMFPKNPPLYMEIA